MAHKALAQLVAALLRYMTFYRSDDDDDEGGDDDRVFIYVSWSSNLLQLPPFRLLVVRLQTADQAYFPIMIVTVLTMVIKMMMMMMTM